MAAMGIAQKINMVPMQIALGFSQGIMPLVGYNFSSGNRKRMKDAILFAMKLMVPITVFVSFCYYLGAGGIVSAFMKNKSIIGYGTRFLRGFCLEQPLIFVDFLAVGVFQALGMGRYALCFAIMRKILLEIPALYVLNWLFPLYGLAYAQPFAELVLAVAALVMLGRIFHLTGEKSGR